MTDIEYLKKYFTGNLDEAIKRLNNGEAIQYIIGNVDFYGNTIKVNKNVLIPRFETEELCFRTINYIKKYFKNPENILEIGTGSGCISIALKKNLDSYITAIDISKDALDIAKENALLNNVSINFLQSDLFNNVKGKFDVIISNPPYISYEENIMDVVKNNEPHLALYAPDNGLYFYKKILKESSSYLNERFLIAFEIGFMQADDIQKEALKYFPNARISSEKDLQGKDRYIFIFNNLDWNKINKML